MRKVDYAHLAHVIADHNQLIKERKELATNGETLRQCDALRRQLEAVAHGFARGAAVDRVAFIQACGL